MRSGLVVCLASLIWIALDSNAPRAAVVATPSFAGAPDEVAVRRAEIAGIGSLRRQAQVAPAEAARRAEQAWVHAPSKEARKVALQVLLQCQTTGWPADRRGRFLDALLPETLVLAREWALMPSVTLGQAVLESGWGRSSLARDHHNLFGIKAGSASEAVTLATTEYHRNRRVRTHARYRIFDSWGESMAEHARLLGDDPRYANARPLWDEGPAFIEAIAPTYASDTRYPEHLAAIVDRYHLDRWDLLVARAVRHDRGEPEEALLVADADEGAELQDGG